MRSGQAARFWRKETITLSDDPNPRVRSAKKESAHRRRLLLHERAPTLAFWMACQTACDVNGISRDVTPRGTSASRTALATAAGAATVPASPAPFTPRMLSGLGVSVRVSSKGDNSLARGTA